MAEMFLVNYLDWCHLAATRGLCSKGLFGEAFFNKEMVTQPLLWTSSSRARQGGLPQSHGCDIQISLASVAAIPF